MPEALTITKPKRNTGRPKVNIDWIYVGELLEAHCTADSIAHRLGISTVSLYRRCEIDNNCTFVSFSQAKKRNGDDLLREKQHEVAMSGDKVMLVWLGKQRLDQKDRSENINIEASLTEARSTLVDILTSHQAAHETYETLLNLMDTGRYDEARALIEANEPVLPGSIREDVARAWKVSPDQLSISDAVN